MNEIPGKRKCTVAKFITKEIPFYHGEITGENRHDA